MNDLGLAETVDRLGESIVITVADAAPQKARRQLLVQSRAEPERTTARRVVSSIVATALLRWESVMFRSALCAVALSFLLVGCYEAKETRFIATES
jgi:hypothetical protein